MEASARRDPGGDQVSHEHSEKERNIIEERRAYPCLRPVRNNRKSSSTYHALYDEGEQHILSSNSTAEAIAS